MESHIAAFIFGFATCFLVAGGVFAAQGHRLHAWLTTPSEDVSVHTDIDGIKVSVVRLREAPAIVTVGGLIAASDQVEEV